MKISRLTATDESRCCAGVWGDCFVILEADGGGGWEAAAVVRDVFVLGRAHDLGVDLNADAIHKSGDVGGLDDLVTISLGAVKTMS